MKKYLIFFFVFFLPFSSNSQEGLFFLDVDYLLNNSNYGKKIISKLQQINDKNLLKINNFENQLKKEESEINKIKNIISESELNTKVNDLKKKNFYI